MLLKGLLLKIDGRGGLTRLGRFHFRYWVAFACQQPIDCGACDCSLQLAQLVRRDRRAGEVGHQPATRFLEAHIMWLRIASI